MVWGGREIEIKSSPFLANTPLPISNGKETFFSRRKRGRNRDVPPKQRGKIGQRKKRRNEFYAFQTQREICLWEPPYFESFFQIWRRFSFFWNCQKTGAITRAPCTSANAEDPKNIDFPFWLFLTKVLVTGSPKFAQNIPSVISTNLILYFFCNLQKKKFALLYIRYFWD